MSQDSGLRIVDAVGLRRLLPVRAAIDALDSAFGTTLPTAPDRQHLDTGAGELLLMPAWDAHAAGVKLVTVKPDNPDRGLPLIHGLYVLFETDSMAPVAVFDGAALTGLRTAAVSGLATRYLCRADAAHLVVFGSGVQARAHIGAMRAERPIDRVTIVSRSRQTGEALVGEWAAEGVKVALGSPDAVEHADLVCTCTTSPTPVFEGTKVRPGTHINAVGAYRPTDRELDGALMGRARVVVETRAAALAEAGDILLAIEEAEMNRDDIAADLAELVAGAEVRHSPEDITVFKSVGVAFEDLVVASAAFNRFET